MTFDATADTIGSKLLPLLRVGDVALAFSLKKKRDLLCVEQFQTFLFQALFFMLEFDDNCVPARKPSQERRRAANDICYNVPVEAKGSPADVFHPFIQHPDVVVLLQAKLDGPQEKGPTTPTLSRPAKPKQMASTSISPLMALFASLNQEQIKLFTAADAVP